MTGSDSGHCSVGALVFFPPRRAWGLFCFLGGEGCVFLGVFPSDPEHPFQPTHQRAVAGVGRDSGNGAANPCRACGEASKGDVRVGNCVKCKVQPGMDRTYTTVRPLKLG